jgi:1-acyl-sn-glycerol-3-phosphate acyltransferase
VVSSLIYHAAIKLNSFWMIHITGIRLNVHGEIGNHPSPIVISNHQSWFDICVLQEVIMAKGPILKFLVKRELAWVPVIGWGCVAMNFPLLHRSSGVSARTSDFSSLQTASRDLSNEPGALLIFVEGTRFTEQKKETQRSPYKHLLKPRVGGMRILRNTASPETPVLDITISFDKGIRSFWHCLHGKIKRIDITIEQFTLGDIEDMSQWLKSRWQAKEKILEAQYRQRIGRD